MKEYKVGDKVRIIKNESGHHYPIGYIVEITGIDKSMNGEIYYKGDWYDGARWYFYGSDCEPVDDFEDSNMEEWVEESNEYKFETGDEVKIIKIRSEEEREHLHFLVGKTGVVVRELDQFNKYNYIYSISINNLDENSLEFENLDEDSISEYFDFDKGGGILWRAFSEEIVLYDDVEDSNMEEWIEENKVGGRRFKKGDKVKYVKNNNKEIDDGLIFLGKIGTVKIIYPYSEEVWCDYLVRFDLNDGECDKNYWRITTFGKDFADVLFEESELSFEDEDETEEQNYEEWLDESVDNKHDIKVGDRFICISDKYQGVKNSNVEIGKIYTILNKNSSGFGIKTNSGISTWDMRLAIEGGMFRRYDDDIPEEQNFEEWIDEGNEYKFKIGEKVLHTDPVNEKYYGIIKKIYSADYYDVDWYKKSNHEFVASAAFYSNNLIPFDDEPEESNFEEWLEESNKHKFKIGDRIKIIKILDSAPKEKEKLEKKYLNKTGIISLISSRFHPYWVVIDGGGDCSYFCSEEIKLLDEPEESNFEEWIEESNKYKFSYGDKVSWNKEPNLYGIIDKFMDSQNYIIAVFKDNVFVGKTIMEINKLKPYDGDLPEETNFEEWFEEKTIVKYENF